MQKKTNWVYVTLSSLFGVMSVAGFAMLAYTVAYGESRFVNPTVVSALTVLAYVVMAAQIGLALHFFAGAYKEIWGEPQWFSAIRAK